jgi:hypothetical protein
MKNENHKITEQQYLNAIKIINEYSIQLKNHCIEVKTKNRSLQTVKELDYLDLSEISVRLYNILKFNFEYFRLIDITKEEFFKARNAGVGTYNDLCKFIGVTDLK